MSTKGVSGKKAQIKGCSTWFQAVVWKVNSAINLLFGLVDKKNLNWHFLFVCSFNWLNQLIVYIILMKQWVTLMPLIIFNHETMDSLFTVAMGMEWSSTH